VQYYLGVFATQEQAAEEYRIAAKRLGKFDNREYSDTFTEETRYQHHVLSNSEQSSNSCSSSNEPDFITTSGSSPGLSDTSTVLQSNLMNEERKYDDKNNLNYMVPISETSQISAKIKLGKIGNEILSRIQSRKEHTDSPSLTALRYTLIQSVRVLRNPNTTSSSPIYDPSDFSPMNRNTSTTFSSSMYRQSDLTDDETIFEEV
jgi:hypothetical protein